MSGTIRVPQALVDDAVFAQDLMTFFSEEARRERRFGHAPAIPYEERQRLAKERRSRMAAKALPVLAPEVAADIVEAIHEGLERADGEGLGAPYDEEAIGTAVYVVERLKP